MSKSDRFKRLAENRESESSNPQKPDVIKNILGSVELENSEQLHNPVTEQTATSMIRTTDTEQTNVSLTSNSDTEQSNVITTRNSDTEQSNVTDKSISNTEQLTVPRGATKPSATEIPRPIEEFEKRLKKPTVEETHTRATWLVRNDLLKRLEKLAKHQHRGFKTHLVNYALERILDEIESK